LFDIKAFFKDEKIGALIAKVASGWLLLSVLGAGVSLLSQVFLARTLGADEYGWYVLYLAWIQILVVPAVFGFDTAVLKFTPQYLVNKRWGRLRGVITYSTAIVAALSLLMIAGALAFMKFLDVGWPKDRQDGLVLALALLPVLALSPIAEQVLRGLKRVFFSVIAIQIFRPLFLLVFVLVGSKYTNNFDAAVDAISVNIVGAVLAMFGLVFVVIKYLPRQTFKSEAEYSVGTWSKVALPMVFMSGMYILLGKVDVVMLGQLVGASEVGVYAVTGRLTGLVGFGLGAVNSIAAPLLAEHYSKGDNEKVAQTLSWSARIATLFTVVSAIFLLVFGEWILTQFGPEFSTGFSALLILLVGACANAFAGSVGYMMIMGGKQQLAAMIVGGALVVNVVLNIILIPRFGIVGAAIATSVATMLWNIVMYAYVKVEWGLDASILGGRKKKV